GTGAILARPRPGREGGAESGPARPRPRRLPRPCQPGVPVLQPGLQVLDGAAGGDSAGQGLRTNHRVTEDTEGSRHRERQRRVVKTEWFLSITSLLSSVFSSLCVLCDSVVRSASSVT